MYAKKAYAVLEKSLKYNIGRVLYSYGYLNMNGIGTKPDYKKAEKYLLRASTRNIDAADNNLGILYEEDKNGKVDLKLAEKYYRRAAMNENKYACVNLANLYLHQKRYKKAYYWFNEGKRLGNSEADEGLKKLASKGYVPS